MQPVDCDEVITPAKLHPFPSDAFETVSIFQVGLCSCQLLYRLLRKLLIIADASETTAQEDGAFCRRQSDVG
jgi:hypothetical protein